VALFQVIDFLWSGNVDFSCCCSLARFSWQKNALKNEKSTFKIIEMRRSIVHSTFGTGPYQTALTIKLTKTEEKPLVRLSEGTANFKNQSNIVFILFLYLLKTCILWRYLFLSQDTCQTLHSCHLLLDFKTLHSIFVFNCLSYRFEIKMRMQFRLLYFYADYLEWTLNNLRHPWHHSRRRCIQWTNFSFSSRSAYTKSAFSQSMTSFFPRFTRAMPEFSQYKTLRVYGSV